MNRNYWRENINRLLRHWDERGTEVSLIVLLLAGAGYGVVADNDAVVYWATIAGVIYVALLFFVINPKKMWDEAINQIAQYEERLRPNLSFVFEPERAPFLQILRDDPGATQQRIVRLYRVGIRNDSVAIIRRVRVVIESATYYPDGEHPVPPSPSQPINFEHALNVMARDKKSGFVDVAPGDRPTAYFDVIQQVTVKDAPPAPWMFPRYASRHEIAISARGKWVLGLRVEGAGAYSRVNAVIVGSDSEHIQMRLVYNA